MDERSTACRVTGYRFRQAAALNNQPDRRTSAERAWEQMREARLVDSLVRNHAPSIENQQLLAKRGLTWVCLYDAALLAAKVPHAQT